MVKWQNSEDNEFDPISAEKSNPQDINDTAYNIKRCNRCGSILTNGICTSCKKIRSVKRKRRVVIIYAAVIILSCLATLVAILFYFLKSEKDTPVISLASDLTLTEKFTDRKITDPDSAVKAVADVSEELGIADPEKELSVISSNTFAGYDIYRMQQYYEGLEVYGHQLILSSDENNDAYFLFSDYEDVKSVELEPKITAEQAEQAAAETVGGYPVELNAEVEDELCIYSDEGLQS